MYMSILKEMSKEREKNNNKKYDMWQCIWWWGKRKKEEYGRWIGKGVRVDVREIKKIDRCTCHRNFWG